MERQPAAGQRSGQERHSSARRSPLPAAAESRARTNADQQTVTPVTQSVLSPPRWYHADDGRFHLQYELKLTNGVPLPVKVASLQVLRGDGRRLKTLSGGQLEEAMSLLATRDEPTTELPPSSVRIAARISARGSGRATPFLAPLRKTTEA